MIRHTSVLPSREPDTCSAIGVASQTHGLSSITSAGEESGRRGLPAKRFALRGLKYLGISILSLSALYLAGMNLILRTSILRRLLSMDPDDIVVDYANAHSWLPGKIHVEGLKIRGSDSNIEWLLKLDRCDFSVSFLALTHRRFSASHVVGDGLAFRVRLRFDTATPEHVAAIPPIDGFAGLPLKKDRPATPPPTDAQYKLWSVDLEDVDARHVRELWIDTIRVTGELRVRGRWLFRPVRWLDVGPAIVDINTVAIASGSTFLARDLQGALDMRVHPFDVRVPNGLEIVDYLSTSGHLHGHLLAADTLRTVVTTPGIAFIRGEGSIDAAIQVDHGVFASGTRVAVETNDAAVGAGKIAVDASVRSLIEVENDNPRAVGRMVIRASPIRATTGGAQAVASSATVTLTSKKLALAHGFGDDAEIIADLQEATTPSLGPWALGAETDSRRATASLHVEGDLSQKRGHGVLDFAVDGLSIRPDASGPAAARPRLSGGVSGHIVVDDVSVPAQSLSVESGRLRVDELSAHIGGGDLQAKTLDVTTSGRASLAPEHVEGSSTAVARAVRLRVGSESVAGTLSMKLSARPREGLTDISGTELSFDSVPAAPGPTQSKAWSAHAWLTAGSLRNRQRLGVWARVRLNATDVSLPDAIIADRTSIPAWVLEAVPMRRLDATCEVLATSSSLQVRSLVARGATDSVKLEYAASKTGSEWALLVQEGVLVAGFHSRDGGVDVAPFASSGWFEERAAAIRQSESVGW